MRDEALPPSSRRRRDVLLLVLALLCVLDLTLLAPGLISPDLNLDYPFMDGDSWDWIANGLFLAGHDVRYSGRAPLLPAVIAALDVLAALSWLPLLLRGLYLGTVLAFYGLAARLFPRRAVFAAALALLASFPLGALSLEVMADVPAACLLFLASRSFLLAGGEDGKRRYLGSGLLAGLAALTQQAGSLWAPAAVITVVARRRRDLRSNWFWTGLLVFASLQVGWWACQRFGLGRTSDVAAQQWELLRLHGDSLWFYAFNFTALWGLPAALLLPVGLAVWWRQCRERSALLYLLALSAALAGLFVFLYDFNARRFMVYLAWPAGLMLAAALARLQRRAVFAAAAALAVAGAALPLPGEGHDASWLAAWPLPPLYALGTVRVEPSGSLQMEPAPVRLVPTPAVHWLELGLPARVRRARRPASETAARLDPGAFESDRAAMFLYHQPDDGGGRHRTMTRLGNALRKRTKFLPAAYFEPYWAAIEVRALGSITPDYAVYRARLPGLPASWLVVVAAAGPLRASMDELAARSPSAAPDSPERQRGRRKAEAIASFMAGHDSTVALLPGGRRDDFSQLYLPFVLNTPELFVVEAPYQPDVAARLAPLATLEARRFGDTEVRKVTYLGRKTSVITYVA